MNCKQARKLQSRLVDDMLPPESGAALDEHLRSCDSCRQEMQLLRTSLSVLSEVPAAEPSGGGWERLRAEMERATRPSPVWRPAFGYGLAAVFVALVGLAIFALRPAPQMPFKAPQAMQAPAPPSAPVPVPEPSVAARPAAEPSSPQVAKVTHHRLLHQRAMPKIAVVPGRALLQRPTLESEDAPTDVAEIEADYSGYSGVSANADRLIADGFSVLARAKTVGSESKEGNQL